MILPPRMPRSWIASTDTVPPEALRSTIWAIRGRSSSSAAPGNNQAGREFWVIHNLLIYNTFTPFSAILGTLDKLPNM